MFNQCAALVIFVATIFTSLASSPPTTSAQSGFCATITNPNDRLETFLNFIAEDQMFSTNTGISISAVADNGEIYTIVASPDGDEFILDNHSEYWAETTTFQEIIYEEILPNLPGNITDFSVGINRTITPIPGLENIPNVWTQTLTSLRYRDSDFSWYVTSAAMIDDYTNNVSTNIYQDGHHESILENGTITADRFLPGTSFIEMLEQISKEAITHIPCPGNFAFETS